MSIAVQASSIADRLRDLGDIAIDRVRATPPIGTATIDDLIAANDAKSRPQCELVDQALVEKAMSYEASVVAAAIIRIISNFVVPRQMGLVTGADGFFRLPAGDVRGPDVAFVSRERLQACGFPGEAYPTISPDLAIEVLSPGNTRRK
ncbi:MAG: Uma2 family endonuclease [Pirellulaceae bacterium]